MDQQPADLHGSPDQDGYREQVLEHIASQSRELARQGARNIHVTCPCGRRPPLNLTYRCYFCDILWCPICAKKHFGSKPYGPHVKRSDDDDRTDTEAPRGADQEARGGDPGQG